MDAESEWSELYRQAESALKRRDFVVAAEKYEQALQIADQRNFGDDCVVDCLDGLNAARLNIDRQADHSAIRLRAKVIRERQLAETEAANGADHPDVAECLSRLAFHALQERNLTKAIELEFRSLEIRKRSHGERSFDVANKLMNIASLYDLQVHDQELSASLWEQAVAILEQLNAADPTNSNVAISLTGGLENLANAAFDCGDMEKAESYFRRVTDLAKQYRGNECQFCNVPSFAKVLVRVGKHAEAERMLSATQWRNAPFKKHFEKSNKEAWIELYEATNRCADAEALRSETASF